MLSRRSRLVQLLKRKIESCIKTMQVNAGDPEGRKFEKAGDRLGDLFLLLDKKNDWFYETSENTGNVIFSLGQHLANRKLHEEVRFRLMDILGLKDDPRVFFPFVKLVAEETDDDNIRAAAVFSLENIVGALPLKKLAKSSKGKLRGELAKSDQGQGKTQK